MSWTEQGEQYPNDHGVFEALLSSETVMEIDVVENQCPPMRQVRIQNHPESTGYLRAITMAMVTDRRTTQGGLKRSTSQPRVLAYCHCKVNLRISLDVTQQSEIRKKY